jgi:Skp family chaperone for outer membrane proteins
MKAFYRWSFSLAAICLLFAVPYAASNAQDERPPVIGVIDIQAVLRESAAVQTLSEKIEAQRQKVQEEMDGRERALRNADFDLAQRRDDLSPEAYDSEREKLEREGIELQRQAQEQRRALDLLFSRGMSRVQEVLVEVSRDIAQANGLDLVLTKTTVIIVRPEYDFTGEALQQLNARLSDVDLAPVPN